MGIFSSESPLVFQENLVFLREIFPIVLNQMPGASELCLIL